jgi:uncharacterized protein (DUF4415 family)
MKRADTSRPFPVDAAAVKAAIDASPERVDDPDCPYDPNDQVAVEAFWSNATVRRPGKRGPGKKPRKVAVSVRLAPEVLEFFRDSGEGWQTRINDVLAEYAKAHAK